MKISERLKDAGAMRATLGPPHSAGLDERQELRRRQELEQVRRSGWPELERADLVFGRYGSVAHRPTGKLYLLHRGALVDAIYTAAAAWFMDEHGAIRFLEHPPNGLPQTCEELDERRARRR
jgi:hypothetical protein